MDKKRCYGCMKIKSAEVPCEHCGYDESQVNEVHQLPAGTVLREQYLIGRVLGQGGFGITYLGWDMYLDIPVAIKEYFPSGMVMRETSVTLDVVNCSGDEGVRFRNNKDRFLREAKMLARFSEVPEIVQIKNFFLANNTAYIVMEYVEGITLKQYVKDNGGKLSAQEILALMRPVIEALSKVHKAGLVHRDISPDNIMMLPSGQIKLLDFGAVRDVGGADVDQPLTKSTEAILKQGYAPIEQYQNRGSLGPWTDVYALCATIYYCLAGQVPPDAPERLLGDEELDIRALAPELTIQQEETLKQGMALRAKDRIPDMNVLLAELYKSVEEESAVEPVTQETAESEDVNEELTGIEEADSKFSAMKKWMNSRNIVILMLAAVAVLIIADIIWPKGSVQDMGDEPAANVGINTEESVIYEGQCGDNAYWTLNMSTGELHLFGNGNMYDYNGVWYDENEVEHDPELSLPPWADYTENIAYITMEDGITSIGRNAFALCFNLARVEWSENLIRIGDSAFLDTGLINLELPESVQEIETGAFGACHALTRVELPEGLEQLRISVFYECGALQQIYIGPETQIEGNGFDTPFLSNEEEVPVLAVDMTIYCYEYSPAQSFAREYSIAYEFRGEEEQTRSEDKERTGKCGDQLKWKLQFNTGTLYINGYGEMYDYNGSWMEGVGEELNPDLTFAPWADYREDIVTVIMGDAVESIGSNAFENCHNLTRVKWSQSLRSIGDQAFLATSLKVAELPESVNYIAGCAFNYCTELERVWLPENLEILHAWAFNECPSLKEIYVGRNTEIEVTEDQDGLLETPFRGEEPNVSVDAPELVIYSYEGSPAEQFASDFGIAFNNGTSGKCGRGMYWNLDLAGKTLYLEGWGSSYIYFDFTYGHFNWGGWSDELIYSGYPIWQKMYGAEIEHIVVGDGIRVLRRCLFGGLENLKTVDFGNTVERLECTFESSGIEEIELPENISYIGSCTFNGCENLRTVRILNDNVTVGEAAFMGCSNLENIYFGRDAFFEADILNNAENRPISEKLVFNVYEDSEPQRYARDNGILCRIINE